MTRDETISKGAETYPGIPAVPLGFLPVGTDPVGSGDPYFIRLDDNALVRIPHDAVRDDRLVVEQVEVVSRSVEEFLGRASIQR